MEEWGFGYGSASTIRQAERIVPVGIKVLPFTRETVGPKNWSFLSAPSVLAVSIGSDLGEQENPTGGN